MRLSPEEFAMAAIFGTSFGALVGILFLTPARRMFRHRFVTPEEKQQQFLASLGLIDSLGALAPNEPVRLEAGMEISVNGMVGKRPYVFTTLKIVGIEGDSVIVEFGPPQELG